MIKDGYEHGIKQGIEQNSTRIIKEMLKRNISINTISEITNKSIDDINIIKNSI